MRRRYKYLNSSSAVRRRDTFINFVTISVRLCAAFVVGVVVGFNLRDLMLNKCMNGRYELTYEAKTNLIREIMPRPEKETLKFLNVSIQRETEKPKIKRVFKQLPEKFLKNFPPVKPAALFSLEPWRYLKRLTNSTSRYFMTFLVKSACPLVERRFLIRQTWGSVMDINKQRFGIIFLVGLTKSKQEQNLLERESLLYGDILQSDVNDNYFNLPQKVLASFQWVTYRLGDVSDFYITTDDDCAPNIPVIFDYFFSNKQAMINKMHCGYIYDRGHSPIRKEHFKWGVSMDAYSGDVYPVFCHGGMTIWPFRILTDIYRISEITNYTRMHLEDVLITGILRQKKYNTTSNIVPRGFQGMKGKYRRYRAPFVYHLGLSKNMRYSFRMRWHYCKGGLRVGPNDHLVGKQLSAYHLNATLSGVGLIRGRDLNQTTTYFTSTWKRLRPKRKRIKLLSPDSEAVQVSKNETNTSKEDDQVPSETDEERPVGDVLSQGDY